MPNVSVVIFVAGPAPYLSGCLDSVVNQTLPDVEIVLVCGALSEQASGICTDFKNRYNDIKIVHTDVSKLSDAYDMGVSASTGRYIMFVKSEDFIAPNACEIMFNNAIKNDSDVVRCGLAQFSAKYNKFYSLAWEDAILSEISSTNSVVVLKDSKVLLTCHGSVWATLFRADFIRHIRFTEDCGTLYQEFAVIIKALICASRISVMTDVLYFSNIDDSENPIIKKDEDLLRITEPFEAAKQWMLARNCFDDYIPEFYKQVMIVTMGFYEFMSDDLKPAFYKRLQQFYSDVNMFVFPRVTQMFSTPQVRFLIDILKDN